MTRRMIAATRNPAKVAALRRALAGTAAVGPLPHDISPEIKSGAESAAIAAEEAGESVEAIAAGKALAWSQALAGALIVATDGGLLIPALGAAWEPTRTRRFAGQAANDVARAEALLALAADLVGEDRRIGWREALALARDGELVGIWSAEDGNGLLARDVDPAMVVAGGGFWVPAVWVCQDAGGRRLAELTESERAARDDHWARLGVMLRDYLHDMTPKGCSSAVDQ